MKYVVTAALVIYLGFCVLVYFCPRYFFYNPTHKASDIKNAYANGYQAEVVHYKSADGKNLYAWFTAPHGKNKIIVFMHGNSYNIENFYHKMLPFAEAGYGTMMPEYRGFSTIKGTVSQKNLSADAIAAVRYLNKLGYKNSDIIIYGMSLGSYLGTNAVYELQKDGPFAALVLEVPFDSLLNTVKAVVPVPLPFDYIVRDKYDTTALIKDIKSPILIMGADKDRTIPVELAKKLYELAPNPKKLIIYQGAAHSNLYNFRNYRDIMKWLNEGK